MFHPIDLQGWEQRDTFTHFMQAGCVYSLTRELCVTAFRRYTKESGLRFYDDPLEGMVNIPDNAPPRPGAGAEWNVLSGKWGEL